VRPIEWIEREEAHKGLFLRSRLTSARSVVDVGSGIYPQTFVTPKVHICVEPYRPYLDTLRERLGKDPRYVYLNSTWDRALPLLPDGSVDTIFALDFIEHLPKEEGHRFLGDAIRVARSQVVLFTPLGFYPQSYEPGDEDRWGMHGGRWQTHRSGWEPEDFPEGWEFVACRDFHDVDENNEPLDEPFGAFWAIHTKGRSPRPAAGTASELAEPLPPPPVRRRQRHLRVLFVAMANSPHSAHWIGQLEGRRWELFLFPTDLPEVVPVTPLFQDVAPSVRLVEGWPIPGGGRNLALRLSQPFKPGWNIRAWQLARVIRKLQPDIVHSLEIQHAAYLTHSARLMLGNKFPPWIVSNWGSDTYIFGRLDEHRDRIRQVLTQCDYYTAECYRDVRVAQDLGFTGGVLPILPAAGGVEVENVQQFRQPGPTSVRRTIALRGYQGWAGRALTGLRAVERAADALKPYTIEVYNWTSSPDVPLAVELAAKRTGLRFQLLPYGPHDDIWRLHGRSRALIALAIGDGISTSMLEAITMGSFPIQSHTSCADEWLEHGRTGLLVHPEDVEEVEEALRRVAADDRLVDEAAVANAEVVAARLDVGLVRPQAVDLYERVADEEREESDGRPSG
jgi:glycosyltransferase involved in cell wall biosynthesis